jgi:beta-galactosidase
MCGLALLLAVACASSSSDDGPTSSDARIPSEPDQPSSEEADAPAPPDPAAESAASGGGGGMTGLPEAMTGDTPFEGGEMPAGSSEEGYSPSGDGRTRLSLNADWRFLRSDAPGAEAATFDDGAWADVTLPHTWNAVDGQDGGNNYYRGTSWYRKHHVLAPEVEGKRIYLELDGSNIVTDVFVNGTPMGQHRGGFARFRFDVTEAMTAGSDNVIAVRVSNARVNDVAPLDADFTFFGGLYRDVHLVVTEPLHIDLMDFGSSGVYLDASDVSTASASLRARTRVRNDSSEAVDVLATSVVVEADGRVATRLSATSNLPPGVTAELVATGNLEGPHLWDGRRDPYAYTVYTELSVGSEVVDWVAEPLGVRSFAVDADAGFFLNESYLDLRGVNRHQDRIDRGWAIGESEQDEDMALIEEMGATAIRLAHYQHAQYFYDLADRAGMVVWAEIPLVNAITASAAFTNNARQQLTELIRQNYNHPSIVFWGIGNEQRSDNEATNALLAQLAQLVRAEDPGRLSTYAQCCTSDVGGLPQHADTVGYNTYYGWYDAFGTNEEFAGWADGLHAARPTWKLAVSEYGGGGALSQHAENPVQPQPYGAFHPEEWQNLLHEVHWLAMKDRPYLWGKFVWNMFDFAVDGRNEGETPGRNDKGLVSYDRRTKKDAFYWYKANWSAEPVVYVTSRRFTQRTAPTTTVKIYANVESVELRVNGTSQGSRTAENHIFAWPGVALDVGENDIEAIGARGEETWSDRVTWTR